MRRSSEFTDAVRNGVRSGRPRVVVHCSPPPSGADADRPTVAGFIVSRAVGGAVRRNRVKRRLRHLLRSRLDRVPRGSRVVVRALPPAADATTAQLADDLDRAFRRLDVRRRPARGHR